MGWRRRVRRDAECIEHRPRCALPRWIGHHVDAKRYLCAAEPDYLDRLSPDSVRSLALQGGPMSPDEMRAFETQPFWREAVRLRRYDEGAKVPGLEVPGFAAYTARIARTLRPQA